MITRILNEEKSVSQEVINATNDLFDLVLSHEQADKEILYGQTTYLPLKHFEFAFDLEPYFHFDYILQVKCLAYFLENERELGLIDAYANENEGNAANFEEKRLSLTYSYLNGKKNTELKSAIQHELTHIYQHLTGLHGYENFYEKVTSIAKNSNLGQEIQMVAYLIYLTFKHEQDANVEQYYQYLMSNFSQKGTFHIEDFEKTLQYSVFHSFQIAQDYVDNLPKDILLNALNLIGIKSEKLYYIRLIKAEKRLKTKLKHAFQLYLKHIYPSENLNRFMKPLLEYVKKHKGENNHFYAENYIR